jgi:hypothetical protein
MIFRVYGHSVKNEKFTLGRGEEGEGLVLIIDLIAGRKTLQAADPVGHPRFTRCQA